MKVEFLIQMKEQMFIQKQILKSLFCSLTKKKTKVMNLKFILLKIVLAITREFILYLE